MQNDLIYRSALIEQLEWLAVHEDPFRQSCILGIVHTIANAPAVAAVEVTAQELQFLIDAMYRHIIWMIAGRLDKPECSYDERVALLERLTLFEREHFPDMKAETEG